MRGRVRVLLLFFFSSRRRHTRLTCDWSSDVCSSDLPVAVGPHWQMSRDAPLLIERGGAVALSADGRHQLHSEWVVWHHDPGARAKAGAAGKRLVREGRGAAERTTELVKRLVEDGGR